MPRLWLRCSVACILVFICINSFSACSCRNANPDTQKLTELPALTPKIIFESKEINIPAFRFENVTTNEERVCFAGVSFNSNPSVFVRVDAAHVPASRLLDPTDKIEGIHPKQIHFCLSSKQSSNLKNPYPENDFFAPYCLPEMVIFTIQDLKQAFSTSQRMMQLIEKDIGKFKKLLSQKRISPKDEIPYFRYGLPSRAFQAHIKRVEFQNGKGILVLTEYSMDIYTSIENGFDYVFQGITNDGKYSITAWFLVSALEFPEDSYKPPYPFREETAEADGKANDAYCLRMERKINALPPDKFQPALTEIENLIRSIRIEDSLNQ